MGLAIKDSGSMWVYIKYLVYSVIFYLAFSQNNYASYPCILVGGTAKCPTDAQVVNGVATALSPCDRLGKT